MYVLSLFDIEKERREERGERRNENVLRVQHAPGRDQSGDCAAGTKGRNCESL
jgi:hypothetical protein